MTTKSITAPLNKHLRKLHKRAQSLEKQVLDLVEQTQATEPDVQQLERQFSAFSTNLISFFQAIRALSSSSKETEEFLRESVSNQLSNAIMVAENLDILAQIDYIMIANHLGLVQDKETMEAVIREMASRGGDSSERLEWLKEALKKNGLLSDL